MISQITNEAVCVVFNKLFQKWNVEKQKDREGLHASNIIEPDETFCFREHVLGYYYRAPLVNNNSWIHLLRIFLEGWYVHKKWQYLFTVGGISKIIERGHMNKFWDFHFTPDAIITILNKRVVVEIKSHSMIGFDKLVSPPVNAVRQAQMYMHFTGIPWGLILVENKNNQEFKVWMIEYDPEILKPFLERLLYLRKLILIFKQDGRLPKKLDRCDFEGEKNPRAKSCGMCTLCFENARFREEFRRKISCENIRN